MVLATISDRYADATADFVYQGNHDSDRYHFAEARAGENCRDSLGRGVLRDDRNYRWSRLVGPEKLFK